MVQPRDHGGPSRLTRGRLLRAGAAGGALVAGGALLSRRRETGASAATPSERRDAEILGFLLTLEHVQEGLYSEALRAGRLDGPLRAFVRTAAPQEAEHVEFLTARAGPDAGRRPRSDFSAAIDSPAGFRTAAIELEELTVAAYIGQGANLTRDVMGDVARIVSVEARHAAWVRDIAGEDPAPRAADPPRDPEEVLEILRARSYIR